MTIVHGRYTTYTHGRCRCELCRAAWATYQRERREAEQRRAEAHKVGAGVITCGMCGRSLKGHDLGGRCYRAGRALL